MFDQNGDGVVTIDELGAFLSSRRHSRNGLARRPSAELLQQVTWVL
jgi:hypothetical protein